MTEIRITFFNGPASNVAPACTKRLEFDDFAQRLSVPNKGPKDGSYFVRGVCRGDRSNKHMLSAWVGVVDADQAADGGPCPPFDAAVDALERMDFEFCAYTSFSHTTKAPRYRILFPLAQPITAPGVVSDLYRVLLSMLKAEDIDLRYTQESATFSQAWYPPRYMTETQRQAFRFAQGGYKTLVPGEVLPKVKRAVQGRYEKSAGLAAWIRDIQTGADIHNSLNGVVMSMIAHGYSAEDVEPLAKILVNQAPPEKIDARLKEIPRSLKGAVKKREDERDGNRYARWKFRITKDC